jgi:hypothetical protein
MQISNKALIILQFLPSLQEAMGYLDATVDEIFEMHYKKLPSTIEIRPYNAEQTKNMRDLNPQGIINFCYKEWFACLFRILLVF